MIRTLIVDDEPPAREQIREYLAEAPDFSVVGECGDGDDALNTILSLEPDVIFMDIRMPRMSGIDVLKSLNASHIPYTIFTTAYPGHAVDAFEMEACDYLLKPLERQRFDASLERVRRYIAKDATLGRKMDFMALKGYVDRLQAQTAHGAGAVKLAVKVGRTTRFLDTDSIECIDADGDYVTIHRIDGGLVRTREPLNAIEMRLSDKSFIRVHRSVIVNIHCVKEARSNKRGGYALTLTSGRLVTTGMKYGRALRASGLLKPAP